MKEIYEKPIMNITEFENEDVITASDLGSGGYEGDDEELF